MARSFSKELSGASPIVFHTDEGTLTDAEHKAVVEASVKSLSQADNVASVSDPFAEGSSTVSQDGRTACATVPPRPRSETSPRRRRGDPRRRRRARGGQRRGGAGRRPARHQALPARGQ